MNTDPQQIRADIDAVLAELPHIDSDADNALDDDTALESAGARLEHAHQILVDALESVEKG